MTASPSVPGASEHEHGTEHGIEPKSGPGWWRGAVLKTVGGFVMGVLVILVVMLTMAVAPELRQAGVDAGIALSNRLQLSVSQKLGLQDAETAAGIRGYVFVDLDAGRVLPARPGVAGGEIACERVRAEDRSVAADCFDVSLTDRILLASVLRKVAAAAPRAIVVDVELGPTHPRGREADDRKLRQAFTAAAAAGVPVFFVIPTDPIAPSRSDSPARLGAPADFERSEGIRGLPAGMSPGGAARSFPRCYVVRRPAGSEEVLPGIPRAVATAVQGGGAECPGGMADAGAARIVYTLPFSDVDVDGQTLWAQDRDEKALQAKLNRVYNRCLAGSVWPQQPQDSPCALPGFFERRIVVIGSSAAYRGDWHYTPLGEMPGPLILVNAIRSEILFGDTGAKGTVHAFLVKVGILFLCSLVWLLYWLQYRKRRFGPKAGGRHGGRTGEAVPDMPTGRDVLCAFLAVAVILAISYALGYSPWGPGHAMDVLLPGLTVGIEVFVEIAAPIVRKAEESLAKLLGWEKPH